MGQMDELDLSALDGSQGEVLEAIVLGGKGPGAGAGQPASPGDNRKVLKWLFSYLGRHRGLTALVYVLVILTSFTGFAILPFTKLVMDAVNNLRGPQSAFDEALSESFLGRFFIDSTAMHVVIVAGLLMLGVKALDVAASFATGYFSEVLTGRIARDLRADLFHKAISFRDDYYHEHTVGEMMSRFVQDINGAVSIFTMVFIEPVVQVGTFIYAAIYLLSIDWLLGLVALAFAPAYYFAVGPLSKILEKRVVAVSHDFAAINEDLQETLAAAKEIKANQTHTVERVEFQGNLDRFYKTSLAHDRINLISGETIKFLGEVAPIAILVVGSFLIVGNRGTDIPTLIVMFGSIGILLGVMSTLANVRMGYTTGVTFGRQVWNVLQEPLEEESFTGTRELQIPATLDPKVPIIEFEHVTMTYPRSGYTVSDLNFKIYPGQSVAIIGEGGSGKSTALNILFKLYPYQLGSVKVFGQELKELSVESVRRAFGLMTQFPFFFQRSFRENLLYGVTDPDEADMRRMEALCREVGLDEVAGSMPRGYESVITNRGANLSGSQQKRTALVRALMKDPAILLLDEPLSGLSPEQRREVSQSIKAFAGSKTILVITHDLELMEEMDLILLFQRVDVSADGFLPEAGLSPEDMDAARFAPEGMDAAGFEAGELEPFAMEGMAGLPEGALVPEGALLPECVDADAMMGDGMPPRVVQEGVIAEQGSYEELRRNGVLFNKLLAQEKKEP